MVTETERLLTIIKKEEKEEEEARKAREKARKIVTKRKLPTLEEVTQDVLRRKREEKEYKKKLKKEAIDITLKKYEEVARKKLKPLKKLAKGQVRKFGKIIRKGTTRRLGSVIEKAYQKGQPRETPTGRKLALLREKNRQLQLELIMKRRMEAEQVAAEQRSHYEHPDDFAGYEEPPQQQNIEDEYGREQKPSLFQNVVNRLRPNPGILQRLQLGAERKQIARKGRYIRNPSQVGTRYIHGDGPQIKETLMVAPHLSLLGGGTSRGNPGVQPNVLNAPKLSFFSSQINKPKDSLKW